MARVLTCFLVTLLLMSSGASAAPLHAKRLVPEDQALLVRLLFGKLVFVRLPEPVHSVDTILPDTRLLVGENSPYISLGLVDPTLADGHIGAYGVSGKLYVIFFEQVTAKPDLEVAITQVTATKPVQGFTALSLVRNLRGPASGGARVPIPGEQVKAPLLPGLPDARVALHDPLMVVVNGWHGLRVTVKNLQALPVKVDLRVHDPLSLTSDPAVLALAQWIWPPRYDVDLLAVETDILPPHGATTLYVIYKERP